MTNHTEYPCELLVDHGTLGVKGKDDDVPVCQDSKELEEQVVYEGEVFGHVRQVAPNIRVEELLVNSSVSQSILHLSNNILPETE